MFFLRKNIKKLSDETLVQRYRDTENPDFVGELFERYADMVFLVCMKYLKNEAESEDASMQIFEKLLVDLPRYEVRTFKYWLHTVIKNHCLAWLDKQKRNRQKADVYQELAQADVENGQEMTLHNELSMKEIQLQQLEQAISLLGPEQRTCVELFYIQRNSYQEVSTKTGYTLKQVKSYIQNGKRNLKNHLIHMQTNE